jgi:hypothetical protein
MSNRRLAAQDRALIERLGRIESEVARMQAKQRWNGRTTLVSQGSAWSGVVLPAGNPASLWTNAAAGGAGYIVNPVELAPGGWLLLGQYMVYDNGGDPGFVFANVGVYNVTTSNIIYGRSTVTFFEEGGGTTYLNETLFGYTMLTETCQVALLGEGFKNTVGTTHIGYNQMAVLGSFNPPVPISTFIPQLVAIPV